jgi:hypothetical protein
MLDIVVYLIFFTILSSSLFMVLKGFMLTPNAFLTAFALTILAVWGMYGLREGADFETNFFDVTMNGLMNTASTARPSDKAEFDLRRFVIEKGKVSGFIRQIN